MMKATPIVIFLLAFTLAACAGQAPPTDVDAPPGEGQAPSGPSEVELDGSAPAGGRLYDKWWSEAELDAPDGDQPLWASQTTNTRSGGDTWRCKECHGWDYMGADGAYGSGSHFTGFPGVFGAQSLNDGELLAWLDGTANPDHDFSAMGTDAMADMVAFLQDGLIDVSVAIETESKAAIGGDIQEGELLYEGACASCHGQDGRMINFGDEEEPEYLATIATGNPWEFIHKVRAGQPGTDMPSAIEDGWSMGQIVDVLAYAQTLPTEAALSSAISNGGMLYDKWWVTANVDQPEGDNPVWARQTTNTRSGGDTWRCKECHGWDYMGAFGPYGSGSHYTGFPGVFFAQEKTLEEIVAQISGNVDPEHNFSAMGEAAIRDLATFIKEGQVDMRAFVDYETKAALGADLANGEELYSASCMACHGAEGQMLNFGDADDPEFVATIATDNPWEFIHKVLFGQPGTNMPSAYDAGWTTQEVIDLLGFAQTLPLE